MTRKTILVLLLEILVGLAVAGAIIVYAAAGPFSWMPSVRWWSLAGTTALIFWAVVKQFRHQWHRPSFWLEVAGLLAVHLVAYTVVLLRVPEWHLLWFVPVGVAEAGVLILVLAKVAGHAL